MKYYISSCCQADIFFKGRGNGFWCQKCKKEITHTIIAENKKDIIELKKIVKINNPIYELL